MPVTPESAWRCPPRISLARFERILQRANQEVLAERPASSYYNVCVNKGVDPLLLREQAIPFIPFSLGVMERVVFRRSKQLQVLQPVVRRYAIDVMDMLVRLQRSAKMLLHNPAMLKYLPTVNRLENVPTDHLGCSILPASGLLPDECFLMLPVAGAGAESRVAIQKPVLIDHELGSADETGDRVFPLTSSLLRRFQVVRNDLRTFSAELWVGPLGFHVCAPRHDDPLMVQHKITLPYSTMIGAA